MRGVRRRQSTRSNIRTLGPKPYDKTTAKRSMSTAFTAPCVDASACNCRIMSVSEQRIESMAIVDEMMMTGAAVAACRRVWFSHTSTTWAAFLQQTQMNIVAIHLSNLFLI